MDYGETYSPVVKITSIRVLLALATQLDLEVHQFDIKTAFLHGLLGVKIYMELPEGLEERGVHTSHINPTFIGVKQILRCTSNKRIGICW